jgi:alkylhydroperoxidase family enzyme
MRAELATTMDKSAFICSMHGMNRRSTANTSTPHVAWTEAVTWDSETRILDVVYDRARQHFSETELVNLTLCVAAISAWNRIAISFRAVHPTYWKDGT